MFEESQAVRNLLQYIKWGSIQDPEKPDWDLHLVEPREADVLAARRWLANQEMRMTRIVFPQAVTFQPQVIYNLD